MHFILYVTMNFGTHIENSNITTLSVLFSYFLIYILLVFACHRLFAVGKHPNREIQGDREVTQPISNTYFVCKKKLHSNQKTKTEKC
jgi:hypothetical protein